MSFNEKLLTQQAINALQDRDVTTKNCAKVSDVRKNRVNRTNLVDRNTS